MALSRWRCGCRVVCLSGLIVLLLSAGTVMGDSVACLIKPAAEISIGSPVEGLIKQITVDRGDWVTKGQPVVVLESSVEEATVALAKAKAEAEAVLKSSQAKLAFSGRKLARAKELLKTASIARHEADEAQTEQLLADLAHLEAVENNRLAQLDLNRVTAALRLRTIRSPITGVVVERVLSPGELARQTPILKLAQINPLWVEVFAPLTYLNRLKPGMKADIRTEAGGPATYQATITVVNKVIDSASATFGVRLELPNPNNVIPAGLACTVEFQPS